MASDDKKPRRPRKRDIETDIDRAAALLREHGLAGAICMSGQEEDGTRYYRVQLIDNDPAAANGIVGWCWDHWTQVMGNAPQEDDE